MYIFYSDMLTVYYTSSPLDESFQENFKSSGNRVSDWFQSPAGTISNFIKTGQFIMHVVRNVASLIS